MSITSRTASLFAHRATRARIWSVVGLLVIAGGTVGSLIGAKAVSSGAVAQSRSQFRVSSHQIAADLQRQLQREFDLIVSTGGYVSERPGVSQTGFASWIATTRTFERYPEVAGLGLVKVVQAKQLAAFAKSLGATRITIIPAGTRPFYCLLVAGASHGTPLPAGFDFCAGAQRNAALLARTSRIATYLPFTLGKQRSLAMLEPVFGTPVGQFIGWVGMSIDPYDVLRSSLNGQRGIALSLQYHEAPIPTAFRLGSPGAAAESASIGLGTGWSLTTYGPSLDASIFDNNNALALLFAGFAASLLLGALIVMLGTGRARARVLVEEQTDQLRFQALHDGLTNLPNRTLILDRIEQMQARSRRNHFPAAVLFIDLDDFKDINDSLGHSAGDDVLQIVASRLQATIRGGDTVGRLGGDEFVVLVEGESLLAGVDVVTDRIFDVLRLPVELTRSSEPISVMASIGASIDLRGSADDLLRDADMAMYRAKRQGKGQAVLFAPEMREIEQDRRTLALELRSAFENEQFFGPPGMNVGQFTDPRPSSARAEGRG